VNAITKVQKPWSDCYGLSAEIPVSIENGALSLRLTQSHLAAFCVLNPKEYKAKERSHAEKEQDEKERQHLSQTLEPLKRTIMKKARKIVGWSQNLLVNASGEVSKQLLFGIHIRDKICLLSQADDLSGWSFSGSWSLKDGGHGTEKAFVTSHMQCSKRQTVDLTQHFKEEYLDTAPPIQARIVVFVY
jgi:hypothetical protein